jgi:hypothetical protein
MVFRASPNGVKFSRNERELHATAEKLFTKINKTLVGRASPRAGIRLKLLIFGSRGRSPHQAARHFPAFVIDFCARLTNTDQPKQRFTVCGSEFRVKL